VSPFQKWEYFFNIIKDIDSWIWIIHPFLNITHAPTDYPITLMNIAILLLFGRLFYQLQMMKNQNHMYLEQ
jgi:hypothetical protein